mmetsp:Transcript_37000/g.119452  ORF Transcript_37000/g.119452 Transcript_37000/m.119452 type:complete len:414 (-) Transcript_37000:708-1949(-)
MSRHDIARACLQAAVVLSSTSLASPTWPPSVKHHAQHSHSHGLWLSERERGGVTARERLGRPHNYIRRTLPTRPAASLNVAVAAARLGGADRVETLRHPVPHLLDDGNRADHAHHGGGEANHRRDEQHDEALGRAQPAEQPVEPELAGARASQAGAKEDAGVLRVEGAEEGKVERGGRRGEEDHEGGGRARDGGQHPHLEHQRPLDDPASDAKHAGAEPCPHAEQRVEGRVRDGPLDVVRQEGVADLAPAGVPPRERCADRERGGDEEQQLRGPEREVGGRAAAHVEQRVRARGAAQQREGEAGDQQHEQGKHVARVVAQPPLRAHQRLELAGAAPRGCLRLLLVQQGGAERRACGCSAGEVEDRAALARRRGLLGGQEARLLALVGAAAQPRPLLVPPLHPLCPRAPRSEAE